MQQGWSTVHERSCSHWQGTSSHVCTHRRSGRLCFNTLHTSAHTVLQPTLDTAWLQNQQTTQWHWNTWTSSKVRQRGFQHHRLKAAAAANSVAADEVPDPQTRSNNQQTDEVYPLAKTRVLVETAMLAAVGGLAYLLSTILKLESGLGYLLPLPVVLSSMRGGPAAGFKTMGATGFLLVVLLGPLKAISYVLIHGLLAACMGAIWQKQVNFWLCIVIGALVRMGGQLTYLLLSSVTMNENLFAIMMSNVYAILDQAIWGVMGMQGTPSPVAIIIVLSALLLVNAACYVFLLQIIYRIVLQSMGYYLGPLPGLVRKYLYAGMPDTSPAAAQKPAQ